MTQRPLPAAGCRDISVGFSRFRRGGRGVVKTALLPVLLFTFGCLRAPSLSHIPDPLSRQEAVELYNANVSAVASFKASILQWQAQFPDERGKIKTYKEWGGSILYRPPAGGDIPAPFYLRAQAPGKEALVIGSNEKEFWMYSKWGHYARWGKYEHLGKPCVRQMLIPPQLILEFIGLRPISSEPPYPVYKVYSQTNVIEYIAVDEQGYSCRREIIIDRRSNLPAEINAYNGDGQKIMHSELKNYQNLAHARLPADIFLSWPAQKSFIHLKINSYKVDEKDRSKLFIRPLRIPDVDDYQQIDQSCENE